MLRPRSVGPTAIAPSSSSAILSAIPKIPPPAGTEEQFAALLDQGLQAAQRGALEESADFLRRALHLKPRDAGVWNSLGVVLVRQGETARGVDAFSQVLRVNPNHPEAQRNLAVALDRQGRSGEAVAHYRAFLRLATQSDPARGEVVRRLADLSASKIPE